MSSTKQAMSDADEFQLRKLISKLNMPDWSPTLDTVLQECVVQSYFNFDLVATEVNQIAREEAYSSENPIGARDRFSNELCRLRWSYLHLVRKVGQEPSYQPADWKTTLNKNASTSPKEQRSGKENSDLNLNSARTTARPHTAKVSKKEQPLASPRAIKPFKGVCDSASKQYLTKKPYKMYSEIEGQLWKNNITFEQRQKKDFLDVSQEDFSRIEIIDIMGNRTTPSNFNILRDSLRKNKDEIHKLMVENLPDVNLSEADSDASSDAEIVPLDFRTAIVDGKLVIQAKPKEYLSLEKEMEFVEQGKFSKINGPELDPDHAISDLDLYLKSVRKEAFDVNDDNVVLIDPGLAAQNRYASVKLPCEQQNLINNSLSAPARGSTSPMQVASRTRELASSSHLQDGRTFNATLKQAEKQSAQQTPGYYDKHIAAEQEALRRSKLPKGPVFAPPPKVESESDDDTGAATGLMSFDDILNDVAGGTNFLSSGNESEEEKKAPMTTRGQANGGVKVFRAPQAFQEDSTKSAQEDAQAQGNPELQKEFAEHMKKPYERPPPTESDSDTAPCSAIVNEKVETAEERQLRESQNLEESARLASSEDEYGARRIQSARPAAKINNTRNNDAGEKKVNQSEESSEDDQWFAKQRRTARAGLKSANGAKPTAEMSTSGQAEAKRQEREALMMKLKRQAEDAKLRKKMAKKEKGWVGGSTTPRESVSPVVTTSSKVKTTDWNELD